MSIQNAMDFIKAYEADEQLRKYLGMLASPDDVRGFLDELGMDFYDEELEEAYNLMVVKCRDEADHNILTQIKISYIELITKKTEL
jgi:predicted ribosomally synthesized peptide with nif11-like leader